jgi:hypothetical protein
MPRYIAPPENIRSLAIGNGLYLVAAAGDAAERHHLGTPPLSSPAVTHGEWPIGFMVRTTEQTRIAASKRAPLSLL